MKTTRAWQLGVKDILVMSSSRQRPHLKRPVWIIVLVTFVSIFLITAYVYPPTSSAACYIFSSRGCTLYNQPPTFPSRELSDDETISQVVIREILKTPPILSKKSKIAFLFLTPGTLPFEELWDKFFRGHEHRFSVFVHASKGKPVHTSRYFIGRDIHSEKVVWGKISMVDAERRLLAHALLDPDNQQFVLLSDSCIPLHNFDYVYNYLMLTNVSFIDSFVDLGPHGTGRYSEHMMPEVEKSAFRKGSQWFSLKRQHAIIIMADSLYYTKFRLYCKPNMDGRNCYADEHYLPTFFNMIDPGGIANRSVTYVDWSEAKWHPRSFRAQDITYEFLRNLTSIDKSVHFTSDPKVKGSFFFLALCFLEEVNILTSNNYSICFSWLWVQRRVITGPCLWNTVKRPCYLFARKFYPETLDRLMIHFSNYTTV
ncbi:Core-2/I-branching beta-1,6-N-acetylglucosaminyltransferase family protein isoform 4 [Theobroma cacao]|uniref:Core-2/I-branching beta-1,6-N-acetylglucosaminyltransferase family protein isoform 4 n=1 Tax=Theobroma cacao TaxID=3641 RepID=A0A061GQ16_THECC|nr:Core-2/I-branching beta-1,6-N-acetylglucosaminyltransferase family protein isoform 4 [Theobroma cacao]